MFNGLDSNGHKWCFLMKADSICVFMTAELECIDAVVKGFPIVSEHYRYGGGPVMVWAGVTVTLKTQLCIIDGNLNAQRYVNEILQPVVVPFLGQMQQGAIFQDDNADPIVAEL